MKVRGLLVVLALSTRVAVGAESWLFHAPAERARITAERRAALAGEAGAGDMVSAVSVAAPERAPGTPSAPPRLEGISLAADGRAHAWIDGRRYEDGDVFEGQRLRVKRTGVQLLGAAGSGRVYRVGEALRGKASE